MTDIIFWLWNPYNYKKTIFTDIIKHINKITNKNIIYIYIPDYIEINKYINEEESYNIDKYNNVKNKWESQYFPIASPKIINNKENIFIYPEDVKHLNPLNAKKTLKQANKNT